MTYALTLEFQPREQGIGHAPSSHIAAYVLLMCVWGAWLLCVARSYSQNYS